MSDTVLTVLIVAVAVLIGLFMFRGQLRQFFLRANRKGLEARLQTRDPRTTAAEPKGVSITRNQQIGTDNAIKVERSHVDVGDNLQLGEGQTIAVRPDPSVRPKKP